MLRILEKRFMLIGIGFCMFVLAILFHSNAYFVMSMTVGGVTLIGAAEFLHSIKWATNVWKMIVWLSFAPFAVLMFFLLYISLVNDSAARNDLLGYFLFIVVFVATWIFGALAFDINKVKAALLILNAIVITFLSVTFVVYTVDIQHISLLLPQEVLPELKKFELTPSSFIELLFKIVTLPYVLASIWSMVMVELRGMGIVKGIGGAKQSKRLPDIDGKAF